VLGADSLGLALVAVGEPGVVPPPGKVAVVPGVLGVVRPPGVVNVLVVPPGVVTVAPPLPRKVEVVGGLSGAIGATWGAGVPMADGGIAGGATVVDGLVGVVDRMMLSERETEFPPPTPPVRWAAASCGQQAVARRPAAAAATPKLRVARVSTMVTSTTAGPHFFRNAHEQDRSGGRRITYVCVPGGRTP
jgi:hypothetical protein